MCFNHQLEKLKFHCSSGRVFENGQTRCEVYASAVPVNAYVNGIGAVAKGFGDDQMQAFQRNVAELFLIAQPLGLHFDSHEVPGPAGRVL